ncbi:hypothetical protein, partial [Enterobacter hormaechei]
GGFEVFVLRDGLNSSRVLEMARMEVRLKFTQFYFYGLFAGFIYKALLIVLYGRLLGLLRSVVCFLPTPKPTPTGRGNF